MKIIDYEPEHMFAMDVQAGQSFLLPYVTKEYAEALRSPGHSYTGIHDGRVIFCAGLADAWQGRAMLWAWMDSTAGKHLVAIHKAAKRFLDLHDDPRIETIVCIDFEEAHRWVKMLGFELETARMRKFLPNGSDCSMYVRIR